MMPKYLTKTAREHIAKGQCGEKAGMRNVYTCTGCGVEIAVRLRDSGVTPGAIRCPYCGRDAWSCWYRCSQGPHAPVTHEWYRPCDDEFSEMEEWEKDLYENGGLKLRRFEKVPAMAAERKGCPG